MIAWAAIAYAVLVYAAIAYHRIVHPKIVDPEIVYLLIAYPVFLLPSVWLSTQRKTSGWPALVPRLLRLRPLPPPLIESLDKNVKPVQSFFFMQSKE